jgi:hypothetical protein
MARFAGVKKEHTGESHMMYEVVVPQFTKMLQNLSAVLNKGAQYAEMKKFDVQILLNSRLAPDQFNLIRQVQIACDSAKLCGARLTGKEAPVNDDNEKTLPELLGRIQQTISFLHTLTAEDFKGAEERHITQPRWEGKWLTGYEYLLQYSVPNVYFHVTTAYSILRHNGVDVGKKDYLGELPYKS